jgi:hypothetical protein
MALITRIDPPKSRHGRIHDEVNCDVIFVHTDQGLVVQLDTFGRPTRKSELKVSQTIQLNRESAASLAKYLIHAFPDIREIL